MGNTAEKIIESLREGDLSNDLDLIYQASELIRGFSPEVLTDQSLETLKESLVIALERYRNQNEPEVVSGLLWVLSKTGECKYKKIYQEFLKQSFENFLTHNQIVYHMLLALSDCEDEIAVLSWDEDQWGTSHTSLGCTDHDKIAFLARQYLETIGNPPR